MTIQKTSSTIKPDAVAKKVMGEAYNYTPFEEFALQVVDAKRVQSTTADVENFYEAHRTRWILTQSNLYRTPTREENLEVVEEAAVKKHLLKID